MTKRLQVILRDAEYLEVQRAAQSCRMSVAEWVRQALATACQRESLADIDKKIAVIRAALHHDFPSGGIEHMLAQIERGYTRQ